MSTRALPMVCCLLALCAVSHAQERGGASWTPLANPAPAGSLGTMLLLTDGTVMAESGDDAQSWFRLTPDAHGSYVNGTWSALAPMSLPRLYFTSDVLQDGRVWVLGGEYTGPYLDANWASSAEIYDPVQDAWSPAASYPNEAGGCGGVTFTSDVQLTTGSPVVTGIYSTDRMQPGWTVTGSGIPSGATIVSVDSASQVTLSVNAASGGATPMVVFAGNALSCFGDDPSSLLSQRRILTGNLIDNTTWLYSIDRNTWTQAASKVYQDSSDEEGWSVLLGGKVLTYDLDPSIASGQGYAEIYDPSRNLWSGVSPTDGTAKGDLPLLSSVALGYELGPVLRLQDGRALVIGANQHTALYSQGANQWSAGPDIIGRLSNPFGSIDHALFGADDAPAALMPNGHVLFAADAGPNPVNASANTHAGSPVVTGLATTAGLQVNWSVAQADGNTDVIPAGAYITSVDSAHQIHLSANAELSAAKKALVLGGVFSNPTVLFDYDPLAGRIEPLRPALADPNLAQYGSYVTRLLVLPTGQVLFSDGIGNQLYAYTPSGTASAAIRPVITGVGQADDGGYRLTGIRLNGPSAASAYGDDVQSNENYPLVRLEDASGRVFYCRTFNWSETGVESAPESVRFTLNPAVKAGSYQLTVVAGGIASAPVPFRVAAEQLRD